MRSRLLCLSILAVMLLVLAVPAFAQGPTGFESNSPSPAASNIGNGQHGEAPQPEPETPAVLPATGLDASATWVLLAAGAAALSAGSVLRTRRSTR